MHSLKTIFAYYLYHIDFLFSIKKCLCGPIILFIYTMYISDANKVYLEIANNSNVKPQRFNLVRDKSIQ